MRGARGASLTEYALALVVLVVGSIGVFQTLEDNASAEVDNQADCISQRPPPLSCQPAALTPLDGTGGGVGGDPGGGAPGTTETASFQPTTVTATRASDPIFDVSVDLTILDDSSQPLEGQLVTAQVTITASSQPGRAGQSFYVSCTTDTDGLCTMAFDSRYDDVTQVSYRVIALGSDTGYDFGTFNPIVITQPAPDSTETGTG
ncbi:MAG: hypothetical protein OSA99_09425 [Acidimicrobiales bacterium]|nr:hypothetical protein [Acidimicrobiales bacterium]